MADNITLPATGVTAASDEIGGVHYQRVKPAFGVDGTAVDVSTTNPLPVTNNDCVSLLNTTISTASTSSSIDTIGYGAVVVQVAGTWTGNFYFESSNDGTNWDMVLTFSRDSLSLQDVMTSGGLYTVRPSGRYLRIVVTSVAGTMTVNAIGRAAEGIGASDLLSMAMERNNNTPLHVSLDDISVTKLQPAQPLTQIAFYDVTGVVPINSLPVGIGVDVSMFKSLSLQYSVGTTGVATPQWSNDGTVWVTATTYDTTGNAGTTLAAGSGLRFTDVIARFFRVQITTATTAGNTRFVLMGGQTPITNMPTTQPVSGTVTANIGTGSLAAGTNAVGDVGVQYRANATGAATVSKFTAAATTNAANVKATAGRVVGWHLTNTTAAIKYFRFFNLAVAPTMGTSSPYFIVPIPANGVSFCEFPGGISFATGIAIACTGAVADLDATATAAGDVIGAILYA